VAREARLRDPRHPGSESNVKEIYDRTKELKARRPDEVVVLNQFEEFGNAMWHYVCTGRAMEEVFLGQRTAGERLAAVCLTQGSAGTLGCGDYLRELFPSIKVVAGEALQCPTLLYNGHGAHRIEGIGGKHVPWITTCAPPTVWRDRHNAATWLAPSTSRPGVALGGRRSQRSAGSTCSGSRGSRTCWSR
jgi:cysteine synthase